MLLKSIGAAILAAIAFPLLGIMLFLALVAAHQQAPLELRNSFSVKPIALQPAPLRATDAATSIRQGHATK